MHPKVQETLRTLFQSLQQAALERLQPASQWGSSSGNQNRREPSPFLSMSPERGLAINRVPQSHTVSRTVVTATESE